MATQSTIEWTDSTWNPVRVHQGFSRLRSLLCRDLRRAVPRCESTPVRARVRSEARAGEAGGAVALEKAEDDLRQFDERTGTPTRC